MDEAAIARVCHEANRALRDALGEPPLPAWDHASDEQRHSTVDGVRNALSGARTPRENHENWRRRRHADGWRHGDVRDDDAKTHPAMVDYDDLPADQRRKNTLFLAVVAALADDTSDD